MKKIVLPIFICAILCTLLTSCGIPKPPNEDQIANSLPNDLSTVIIANPFDDMNSDVYEMNIKEVVIEKRQTNEKSDTAYCRVTLENEYYRFTKHLELNYNYYDKGGWILDRYNEYVPPEWEVLSAPFDTDDVSSVLDYCTGTVGSGTTTSHLPRGAIEYSFPVEDAHNNGAYKGTAIVKCQFDGQSWTIDKDTTDVKFIWDIVGTWKYSEIEYFTSSIFWVKEIVVTINEFDQTLTSMNGTWYMNCDGSETMISLDNAEKVKIGIGNKGPLVELWSDPNITGMHSYVEFYPDTVKACYATYFAEVQLERQTATNEPDSNNDSTMEGTATKAPQELSSVIDQYFEIVKEGVGNDEESRIVLMQTFPNIVGDELIGPLHEALEYDTIDDFSYELITINQYSMDQADARRMWTTLIEEEVSTGIPDPDAFAEIVVKLTIKAPNSSMDGTVGYCDVLLVQDNGAWGVFFVDDAYSEPPHMLFPF